MVMHGRAIGRWRAWPLFDLDHGFRDATVLDFVGIMTGATDSCLEGYEDGGATPLYCAEADLTSHRHLIVRRSRSRSRLGR